MKFYNYLNEGIHDKGIFKAIMMGGSSACFDKDTLVKTIDGYRKIKNIEKGDLVLTFNEHTKINEWHEVEILYEFENNKEILELTFENGEVVICTEDHKFFVNGEWIKAIDLKEI